MHSNYGIGDRLFEERKRLDLNQTEMGKLGGVTYGTYANYELNKRFPDAECLAKLYAAGVDVLYVITGQRQTALLPPEDRAILDGLKSLKPDQRQIAESSAWAVIDGFRKYNTPTENDI